MVTRLLKKKSAGASLKGGGVEKMASA